MLGTVGKFGHSLPLAWTPASDVRYHPQRILWDCDHLSWGSDVDPHLQPQNSLVRILSATRSRIEILTKEKLVGTKLRPLQFAGLSLPY